MDERELAWEVLKLKYQIELIAALGLLTVFGIVVGLTWAAERAWKRMKSKQQGGKRGQKGR